MAHQHQESHGKTYFAVFIALCVFTLLSVVFDLIRPDSKVLLAALVLSVATAKALCVMAFFMHLKFEGAWKYALLTPTIILAASLPFALAPDIGLHYYTVDVPQVKIYEERGDVEAEPAHPEEDHH